MRVLNVEDRVVLRLLDHLGEVEIEGGVVLPVQHHEPHGVAADLVDHLAQGDDASVFRQAREAFPDLDLSPAALARADLSGLTDSGLLDHLGEVEIEGGVVLPVQHHEPHGVAADLVDPREAFPDLDLSPAALARADLSGLTDSGELDMMRLIAQFD
jgi:hypothetical protein